jgi:hypothetical protein
VNDQQRRLRVTFEYVQPPEWGGKWQRASREGGDDDGILDQYNQLKEWERTGEEQIRNVVLEELSVTASVISE